MYPRTTTRTPFWLLISGAALLVFGGYALYIGVTSFLAQSGNIGAPLTATVQNKAQQTELALQLSVTEAISVPTRLPTNTPIPPCMDFRVNVVKAKVRECAKDTCPTLELMYAQNAVVCVFGGAPAATDWYTVNVRPDSLYPELAYMHSSVLDAIHPTPRPTRTATALPTVTLIPTAKPTKAQPSATVLPIAR